jgi:hypothetical protein
MKISKTHGIFSTLSIICLVNSAFGQGLLVAQHSGSADPTTEGFTLKYFLSGQTTGPTNDGGIKAWITASPQGSGSLEYDQFLTPEQQAELDGANWNLAVTLRVFTAGPSALLNFYTGTERFSMYFGVINGAPFVTAGPLGSNPMFVLSNSNLSYNNYRLVYNSVNDLASLWINGVQEASNIQGAPSSQAAEVDWGLIQTGPLPAQANWNLVSLEIVPEPSEFSLVCFGSGVLLYVILRRHH